MPLERNPGALEKLRDDPTERRTFLRAVGGGAAVATLAVTLAACGKEKTGGGNQVGGAGVGTAQYGEGDAGIVNYALALEYLEAAFYSEAIASGNVKGRALELFKQFGETENSHVETLEGTLRGLGGKPAPKPKASFTLDDPDTILATANQFEAIGANAYLGQADRIQDRKVLAAALAIHSVEARHAAVISTLLGEPIAPDGPFARPITSVDALAQIRPFITA
jgi:Ferritin-like domain